MGNLSGKTAKPGVKFDFIAGHQLSEMTIFDLETVAKAVKRDGFSDKPEHVQHYPGVCFLPAEKDWSISRIILPTGKYFVVVGTADEVLQFIEELNAKVNALEVDSAKISAICTRLSDGNNVLLAIGDNDLLSTSLKQNSLRIQPQGQKDVPELAKNNLLRLDIGFTFALANQWREVTSTGANFDIVDGRSIHKQTPAELADTVIAGDKSTLRDFPTKYISVWSAHNSLTIGLLKEQSLVLVGTLMEIQEFVTGLKHVGLRASYRDNELFPVGDIQTVISGGEGVEPAVCYAHAKDMDIVLVIGAKSVLDGLADTWVFWDLPPMEGGEISTQVAMSSFNQLFGEIEKKLLLSFKTDTGNNNNDAENNYDDGNDYELL